MALDNAVFVAIADAMHIAINAIAKKLGHSEIEVKKIEGYIFWLLVGTLTIFLFVLTLKYS